MSNSALPTAILLLLAALSVAVVVEGRTGDTSIVSGPTCTGRSDGKRYSKNVLGLIDKLVDETKMAPRKPTEDYKYSRSFPSRSGSGAATGGATCDKQLGGADCWACLVIAKGKFKSGCHYPVRGTVQLKDCSIWFDKLV